ncbi:hypothetical protein RBB50_009191 [Rhinocladiella similis]
MPPFPGEETLTTVYADVHTYFDAPTPRPFLHRFDKTSYFYIYYNSTRQASRIEVALHPGSADQAAFSGYLDNVHITNTQHFPTRMTLVVDATSPTTASPASARSSREPDEWRLASADPRDPGSTKYRIHTIDFYFWTQEDAKLIVDICKRLLQPHQLDVEELEESHVHAHEVESEPEPEPEPEPYPHDMVSSVVQNLEHVAISDPAYGKDKNHDPTRRQGLQMPPPPPPPPTQAAAAAGGQVPSPAPVAAASPSPGFTSTNIERNHSAQSPTPASAPNFTPLAYNPAAPAAPEPIAHREDTPPPVDAATGTGLATAAMHDHAYAPAHHPQQQLYTLPGGPSAGAGIVPGPGQQQQLQHQPSPYGHYGSPPPPAAAAAPGGAPSFGPHATTPPQHQHPSFGGPPQSLSSALQTSPRTSGSTFGGGGGGPSSATSPDSSRHPSVAAQHYVPNQDPNAHIFGAQSVQSPGAQFYQSVNAQPHKPLQHIQPQYPDYLSAGSSPPPPPPAPVGGYASYNYAQTGQPGVGGAATAAHGVAPGAGGPYDVHSQLYRPTEDEYHNHPHQRKPSRASSAQHSQPSTVDRLEKGVGKFLKKIEKKIG